MKKLKNKLKYIKISDLLSPIIFLLILPFSLLLRLFNKITKKQLWLVCEDGNTARDNGYHFFVFMYKSHPKINTYYVIDRKKADYKKLGEYSDKVVQFKSIKHWLYYLSANKNISIHKHGNPCQSFFFFIHVVLKLYDNRIFLQHGVIKDDLPFVYYKNARFRIFICGAKREYEYIKENFGYPAGRVQYTGLARFDKLHDITINKKQILLMPTWRSWFGGNSQFDKNESLFKKTDFYKFWNELLLDKNLKDYLEVNNIIMYFYPHQHMQKFLHLFTSNSKNVKIVDNSIIDIQTLLKDSALLVTDYSSVFMDFAYMNKPILYYQFDEEEFRSKHLAKGYFDYRDDGFGKVITNKKELIDELINLIKNDYVDDKLYQKRRKDFFEIRDNKNCERIYKVIKEDGDL